MTRELSNSSQLARHTFYQLGSEIMAKPMQVLIYTNLSKYSLNYITQTAWGEVHYLSAWEFLGGKQGAGIFKRLAINILFQGR